MYMLHLMFKNPKHRSYEVIYINAVFAVGTKGPPVKEEGHT